MIGMYVHLYVREVRSRYYPEAGNMQGVCTHVSGGEEGISL